MPGRVAGLEPDVDRRREVVGRLDVPARGAVTAVRMSTPPSTSAETSCAWICGWASPPIEPGHDPRLGPAGSEQHPGQERVEGSLAGLEDVGVARIQAEVAAPVLVVDAGLGIDHARPEAEVVGLDQADRIALAVDGRQVDRPAAARVGRGGRLVAAARAGRSARRARGRTPGRAAGRPAPSETPGPSGRRRDRPWRASPPRSRGGSSAGSRDAVRPERLAAAAPRTRARIARSSSATSPELFGGWVVTRTPR